ncbi:MAG TPA: hemerythrin domain-containing protein [Burkholderiales bacterium]|nr:hemerythrin domain-containing protein [Burkholderiales bacterium]
MNAVMTHVAPKATNLIRADHTKVLAAFHRYERTTPAKVKLALVSTITLAIEIHAQLEEEIFYPAMRTADPSFIDRAVPEHDQMRRLMDALRGTEPTDSAFDATFMELMRTVMHHVADEETILLPQAERLLERDLTALGARMMRRKLELMRRHAGELARNRWRRTPATGLVAGAGALIAGSFLLRYALRR